VTYLIEVLEIEVRVLNDVKGLVTKDFTGVVFKDRVEAFGHLELLTVLARH